MAMNRSEEPAIAVGQQLTAEQPMRALIDPEFHEKTVSAWW